MSDKTKDRIAGFIMLLLTAAASQMIVMWVTQ